MMGFLRNKIFSEAENNFEIKNPLSYDELFVLPSIKNPLKINLR